MSHNHNAISINFADRLGFKYEGTIRHHDRLLPCKEGSSTVEGDECPARHLWLGSLTVDDWRSGGARERLETLMARPVEKHLEVRDKAVTMA